MPTRARANAVGPESGDPPTDDQRLHPVTLSYKYLIFRSRKTSHMVQTRQDLAAAVGLAMQRYQRSVQAYDDAIGRRLGLGPTDLRCLDWLADGPKPQASSPRPLVCVRPPRQP